MLKVLVITFFIFTSSNSWALLAFEDAAFPELITSGRALAMGNAFISKVDDPSAAFYNPAGLGTVRRFTFHLMNFHMELNKGFLNLTEGDAFDTPGKFFDNFSTTGLRDNLLERPGNLAHAKFSTFPNITFRYFTLGYMFSQSTRAAMDATTSDFEFAERRDMGPVAALNFSLFGGILKFGASGVWLDRKQLQKDFSAGSALDINDSDYTEGRALIVTAGTRITLPWTFLPTLSAVIRNTGEEEFDPKPGSTAPPAIPQTVDVGFSITPQIGKRMRVHLEANYRDITDEYANVSKKRKMSAGIEFDLARTYFFRLGYGDGFGSGGIGIQTRKVFIDLSTYAVDLSPDETRGREDRRFLLSLSSGF